MERRGVLRWLSNASALGCLSPAVGWGEAFMDHPLVRSFLPHPPPQPAMFSTWLKLALVCLSAQGAASFDAGGDVPGSPGNLADAMRGAAWPTSLCTARLHH